MFEQGWFDEQWYLFVQEAILLAALIARPRCVGQSLCTIKVVANHEKEGQVAPAHHEHWKSLNVKINLCDCVNLYQLKTWLPDGYSKILRSYMFGPSGFWTMAPLRYAAKFDPFLSLDRARVEGVRAQSKERKGIKFSSVA